MRGYVVKRGPQSFAAVVYLGRDAQGKEQRKWYSFKTRREAEAHLAYLVSQLQSGVVLPSTKLRLGDYLEQWLRDYAEGAVGPVTLEGYRTIIRRHLTPALGHFPLARLSPQAIQVYLTHASQRGLSSTTVRHHAALLHEALHYAVKWGLIPRNPSDLTETPRGHPADMHVWDEEQVRLFLAEARRSSPYYVLYLAALTTGMRQGELLGLRWQDVDLLLREARISQTFYRLGRRQIFKTPKTQGSRRAVALLPVLVDVLRGVKEEQDQRRQTLGPVYQDRNLIFCQPDGKPLHAHNIVRRDFRKVTERAKVPRIRFHDLRHCHATLLLKSGAHPKVVQERLGHSTPAFTLHVYSHVLPGMQHEAANRLQERLFRSLDQPSEKDSR